MSRRRTNAPAPGQTMTDWIRTLLDRGEVWRFYKSREWLDLRGDILREQKGKCEWCRAKSPSVLRDAETVHHMQHVRRHPELALSRWYVDGQGRRQKNLVALCHECHDKAHKRFGHKPSAGQELPLTPERW